VAALPDEVLERLAMHGPVRLSVGDDLPASADAPTAPLDRQLYLFVQRGGAVSQRLNQTTRASFLAEDRAGEYLVRVTGRAVAGRTVLADPRRSELMHWLPPGVPAGELVAVRFHPETLEYIQGRGATRTRAAGPVPGAALPGALSRWWRLASDRVVVWFFALAGLDWLSLFFLVDLEKRGWLLLSLMILAGSSLLGGVVLVDQSARLARWREGLETEPAAALMLEGWDAPGRVRAVGSGMMALGGVLACLLAAGAGWKVGAWTVVSSGAPLVAAFYGVRHALRRRDAAREVG
jgi:hypothetical protein